jgi:hypothetical protein
MICRVLDHIEHLLRRRRLPRACHFRPPVDGRLFGAGRLSTSQQKKAGASVKEFITAMLKKLLARREEPCLDLTGSR